MSNRKSIGKYFNCEVVKVQWIYKLSHYDKNWLLYNTPNFLFTYIRFFLQIKSLNLYAPIEIWCRKTETRQTECTEKIKIINPLKRFLICGCCCWILLLHLPLPSLPAILNCCPCITHTQRCQVEIQHFPSASVSISYLFICTYFFKFIFFCGPIHICI